MNKSIIKDILTEINYFAHFSNTYLNKNFSKIDYGKRLGNKTFKGLFDATKQYTYNGAISENQFTTWHKTMNDAYVSSEELLCTVLEIFNWGKVLTGNVKTALDLYKNGTLKDYIQSAKEFLKCNEILSTSTHNSSDIIWSSGWTKVYSFINQDILIYDSRVSAFLNHTLTYECDYSERQLKELRRLSLYLFNFGGATGRRRLLERGKFGFRSEHPSGLRGFNANLVGSWIVQLTNEELNLNREIRDYERAFFMLGFDLNQIVSSNKQAL